MAKRDYARRDSFQFDCDINRRDWWEHTYCTKFDNVIKYRAK